MFDLPTTTKQDKRNYTEFRDFLLSDGYLMLQFSVYVRSCVSFARQETHLARLRGACPAQGKITGVFITNAQWNKTFFFYGISEGHDPPEEMPEQLVLW